MEVRTWDALEVFERPISGQDIKLIKVALPEPVGLGAVIRRNWDHQLSIKKDELEKAGVNAVILPYHLDRSENPLNAIYEGNKPKMWPGLVVSLVDIEHETTSFAHKIKLNVGQTYYPLIASLKNPEIDNLYRSQKITKPRPSLGICTFIETIDNRIALTVRGIRTNIYPGRVHAPGGNPTPDDNNIVQHQVDEISEEMLIGSEEYSHEFQFGGIVTDQEVLLGKPDLIGWVKINLDSDEIRRRVFTRPDQDRPADVIGVVFAPASEFELLDYLTYQTIPTQFCPPSLAGLYLYGIHHFGPEWGKVLNSRLKY